MKTGIAASFAILFAVLALPAAADEVLATETQLVETPTLKSRILKAEWYRNFTADMSLDNKPAWQAEPTDDQSFRFGANTRWQLKLDMLKRPSNSPLPSEEMKAGATFRVTPRLSVGGEVSVGADKLNNKLRWEDEGLETGVRLKSAFKF